MLKLFVSEIFRTIQGEGPDAGRPAVFIRLSGCNLRCVFKGSICDTPYTSYKPEGEVKKIKTIVDEVKSYGVKYVVLTGGEPLIQKIRPLILLLQKEGYTVSVETNGTKPLPQCQCVVSPKLEINYEWKVGEKTRLMALENVQRAVQRKQNVYLKFVVESSDTGLIQNFVEQSGISKDRVYLMPEGITGEQIKKNGHHAWEAALRLGYRYCSRYHVQLFDNKRKV